MANLSSAAIQALFEKPKNREQIDRCIRQHNRLRFHVHPATEPSEVGPAYVDFINWVRTLLPADKFKTFSQLLTLPVPTVDLTSEIFAELRRALEGENGFLKFDFRTEGLEADFNEYRQLIREEEAWRNEGFEAFKTAINSVLIVDVPPVQAGERPAPYFYFLEPELLYDIDINYKGEVEYIIFNEGDLTRYVFDSTHYRTYTRTDSSSPFALTAEAAHSVYNSAGERIAGLGYTPARMFWDVPQSRPEIMQRKGVLTHVLSRLDKLIFWDISTEYYETYGTYPIYWEYLNDCDYTDEQGNTCEGGFVAGNSLALVGVGGLPAALDKRPCPKCTSNRFIGPGSVKRVEAPADNTDADLREPAGIINIDVAALQNAQKRLEQRKQFIYRTCVGAGGEAENDQAKNEKQVKANFESRQNVLLTIKQSFERARKWVLDTVCLLRYSDNFISSTVLLGDEFYLVNEADIAEQYRADKTAGMPVYHLSTSLENLYQTKYKNNPDMVQRLLILSHLEPYPDKTVTELATIEQQMPGTINPDDFILKLNFDGYLKRFESEELDVLRFGINTDFQVKINSIKQKLISYVTADREKASAWVNQRRIEPVTVPANAGGGNGNIGQ